jgi:hypothetical protein
MTSIGAPISSTPRSSRSPPRRARRRGSARLPAHRRQQRVGPLALEHAGDAFEVERLEVRAVGEPGSVMIVAGFELTTIVLKPSSRSTFSAWQPA